MQHGAPTGDNQPPDSSRFFILAGASLLAMGLVWSIDASPVYIFLGGTVYFLFLGFYNRPKNPRQTSRRFGPGSSDKGRKATASEQARMFFARAKSDSGIKIPGVRRSRMAAILGLSVLFSAMGILVFVVVSVGNDPLGDVERYTEIGDDYFFQQQYDSAYNYYRKALWLVPENETAALGVGNSLLAMGKEDSAAILFDKVLVVNPDNQKASYGKALVAWNKKRYDDAIRVLLALLERDPEYHDALLLMGDSYYVRQRYSEAIGWYEQAFAHEDQRTRILCHIMAYIYDTQGDYPKAIDYYREALRYDSSVVEIYQRLGEIIPGKEGDFFRARANP
jgi:tetratricopeptide (TPR) repeat protein